MNRSKRKKLAKAGWKVGTAAESLHLTAEEELYVDLKASLSQQLRRQREKSHLTQEELARMLKPSQSRIAKMEKGDPSVSIDLLIKSLLALGTTRCEIAKIAAQGCCHGERTENRECRLTCAKKSETQSRVLPRKTHENRRSRI